MILSRAEALARLRQLAEAVDEYNKTRVRAGLTPHVLGTHVTTQAQVLDAIWHERRLELAFERFRLPDLVRTGRAIAVLGLQDEPRQVLYPIPQEELDVAPNLEQNPGYRYWKRKPPPGVIGRGFFRSAGTNGQNFGALGMTSRKRSRTA